MSFKTSFIFLLVLLLASCDYTTIVSVQNHSKPVRVKAWYDNKNLYRNSDSLLVEGINNALSSEYIIRTNTSADSYTFVAPSNTETYLQPLRIGQAIRQVELVSGDSVLQIPLHNDQKRFKQLKEKGIVVEKGFLIRKKIIIINQ